VSECVCVCKNLIDVVLGTHTTKDSEIVMYSKVHLQHVHYGFLY